MIKGQWKRALKHISDLKTDSGFRLVRVFSASHNAQRMKVHCARLQREMSTRPGAMRFKLFLRRRKRQQLARLGEVSRPGHHYPGQNEATGHQPGAEHSDSRKNCKNTSQATAVELVVPCERTYEG